MKHQEISSILNVLQATKCVTKHDGGHTYAIHVSVWTEDEINEIKAKLLKQLEENQTN